MGRRPQHLGLLEEKAVSWIWSRLLSRLILPKLTTLVKKFPIFDFSGIFDFSTFRHFSTFRFSGHFSTFRDFSSF